MGNQSKEWLECSELVDEIQVLNHQTFDYNPTITVEQNLIIASLSCITQEENVLLATKENRELALILEYLYNPKYLMILFQQYDEIVCTLETDYWRRFHERFSKFISTMPCIVQKPLSVPRIKNTKFDVILYSSYETSIPFQVDCTERFQMILGEGYESFVEIINNSPKLMKDEGRLIVIARPCWLLPVWELLECNQLQFDYQDFHYYFQKEQNQNRLVCLRFSYHSKGIDTMKQKRNLIQFMEENNIDRLFAHRNNFIYPYHELAKEAPPAYVSVTQNRCNSQYFFSAETTEKITALCRGYTACLVVPSIAICAYDKGKNIVLFEMDNRFRSNGELKFVKYDLYKGLHKLTVRKYGKKFNTVICDPPFNVDLDVLAKDIYELILNAVDSCIYVVYPRSRASLLCNAMKKKSMHLTECELNTVEYSKPPKLVRQEGADAIKLYKFYVE